MLVLLGLLIVIVMVMVAMAEDRTMSYTFSVLGVLFALVLGLALSSGTLKSDTAGQSLKTNAIYEVVSAEYVGQGKEALKVAVILREQDGDLVAYLLDRMPPKVFKKTNDPKDPYQPYFPKQ